MGRIHWSRSRNVERGTAYESEPRENEIENLVDQLDVDPELADETV